ncbi:MAG: hypothetical protein ACLFWD_08660 [Anaerolineales bacterium]
MPFDHDRPFWLMFTALILTTLACTTLLPGTGEDKTSSGSSDSEGRSDLICEQLGYPCSLAEADPAALERSGEILATAEETYLQQGSMLAAGQQLAEEDDVVELAYDDTGLWFRVEGGTPMWLWDYEEVVDVEPEPLTSAGGLGSLARPVAQDSGPVGEQPPGQEPTKRALFILPWAYAMGDDSGELAAVLSEHRNYQCSNCIERQVISQDPREGDPNEAGYYGPSLDRFRNWNAYDLLYVFAHGRQWCGVPDEESGGYFIEGRSRSTDECAGMLTTGRFRKSIFDDASSLDTTGAAWGRKPGDDWWIEALSPDFFQAEYAGGLQDSILFFNACQLMNNDSFSSSLAGEDTGVVGWTQSVRVSRGIASASTFYEALVEDGLRVGKAVEKAKESAGYNTEDTYAGAELDLNGDENPRAVEVITWMHPIYQQEVQQIGSLPTEGVPGDSEDDALLVRFRVDGIDEDQNPADFTIHIKIGDQELDQTLQPTDQIDDYVYEVREEIDLGFPVEGDEDRSLEAWIDLPEGGQTRHYLEDARLASCGWTGSVSGARTGDLKGDIALDLIQVSDVDPEQLKELEALGVIESVPSIPSVESLSGYGDVVMLTGQNVFPAVTAHTQGTFLMLSQMDVGMNVETRGLQIDQRSERYIEGSVNTGLTHATSQQAMNLTADFVWNAGSHCDIDLILEAGKLQAPAESAD